MDHLNEVLVLCRLGVRLIRCVQGHKQKRVNSEHLTLKDLANERSSVDHDEIGATGQVNSAEDAVKLERFMLSVLDDVLVLICVFHHFDLLCLASNFDDGSFASDGK